MSSPIEEAKARLVTFMQERGVTQSELAYVLASRSHASEILAGKRWLSRSQLFAVCRHWKVSADYLLGLPLLSDGGEAVHSPAESEGVRERDKPSSDHIPDAGKMVPPPGEGPSRESVARIIDPQAMSPGAVTSTGKPFAGSVRESDALRAADAILALFPPARPDGWRPPTEADQDGKPFIGWNGHVRQWVRWMEGAWRSSETAAPWVPTLIFDLPIPPQEETGRDDVCTDCGGTGTTYQTERPCACQVPPHEGGGKHD